MNRRLCVRALLLVGLLLGAVTADAAEEMLVTGNQQGLWVVARGKDGKTFQMVTRPTAGKWTWVTTDIGPGTPTSAAAVGTGLHLFVQDPFGYLIFSGKGDERTAGPNPLPDSPWRKDVQPLRVCEAVRFAKSPEPTIVAVVPRITGPQSTPPAPGAPDSSVMLARLAVFQRVIDEWVYLTEVPGVPLDGQTRVLIGAAKGTLYVLVSDPDGSRFAGFDGEDWRDVSLETLSPGATVLAIPVFEDELTIVAGVLVGSGGQRLEIARWKPGENRFVSQPITTPAGEARVWANSNLPQAARLGNQVALLWGEGDLLRLGLCDPVTGGLLSVSDVNIFQRRPIRGGGKRILQYFITAVLVLVAILFGVILFRQRTAPKPFTLPQGVRPARLGKRTLAALVDLIPFGFIGTLVFLPPDVLEAHGRWAELREFWEEFLRLVTEQGDSADVAYGLILSLLLYTGYSILMELRFGATLGKRIFKLRVVGNDAGALDLLMVILRNLCRVLEIIPPVVFFALPLVLLTRHRRRLGDLLSRTVVIETSPGIPPSAPEGPEKDQSFPEGP